MLHIKNINAWKLLLSSLIEPADAQIKVIIIIFTNFFFLVLIMFSANKKRRLISDRQIVPRN
jgi:hypothetical protein